MKCPFCEKENDCDCFVQVNKASLNEAIARAEKAEGELVNKDRYISDIEEVYEQNILKLKEKVDLYKKSILPMDYLLRSGITPKELLHNPEKRYIYDLARHICDKEIKEIIFEKEKAEGELKAIKDRIEAVTECKINFIINNHLEKYYFNMGAFEPEPFRELVSNLIKQIGGEK